MQTTRDRTYVAALLLLAHLVAYADRQVVNVLLPAFKQSLGLTLVQASVLQGFAFSLFFALAGIPLGRAADRWNRRNLLAAGLAFWSLATVACGLSNSFWQLFLARLSVGVGEACLVPVAASLLADYYAPHQRGRAINFVQIGAPLGSLVAMVGGGGLLTWLDTTGALARTGAPLESWQAVFLTLGGPGLLLAALFLGVKEPPRGHVAAEGAGAKSGILAVFRQNPGAFAALLAMQGLVSMVTYALLGWAPTIFMTSYGQSAAAAGSLLGLILISSGIGAYVVGGISSDVLTKWRPRTGRIIVPGATLPFAIAALAWLYVSTALTATVSALAVTLFAGALVFSSAIPSLQALVPTRARGQAMAVLYLVTNLAGAGLSPMLVAAIAEWARGGETGLQQALATVCLTTTTTALVLWSFLLRAYPRARNYEAEEIAAAAKPADAPPLGELSAKLAEGASAQNSQAVSTGF